MQNIADVATAIVRFMQTHGIEWADYGQPTQADIQIALSAMIDYTDSMDERTLMELPATGLQIIRDGESVEVWLKVGTLDAEYDQGELPRD